MASSLRIRSLRSAISIRAAPSWAPPSISRCGRATCSSRSLSSSQPCQPLRAVAASTTRPKRALAAISRSWFNMIRFLPELLVAQLFDFVGQQMRFAPVDSDAFEHVQAFAKLLDFAFQFGFASLLELLEACVALGNHLGLGI